MSGAAPSVAALVLAAGRSSRMGRDKALIELRGEPALRRIVRVLRESGVDRVIVVLSSVRAEHRRLVNLEGLTTALNLDPTSSQTASIRIGLANLPEACDGFLLCPVDVPLFEAEDVRALVAGFGSRPNGVRIVAPGDGKRRGHPALFEHALAAEFRALGDADPAHAVIRRDPSRVLHLALRNEELYRDLDTEADLEAARRRTAPRSGT